MYCKHCYKMIEDGTTICPFCGKDQSKRDMPGPLKTVLRILLGIGVWMGSMLLIAIIGSTFGFANNGGFVSTLYSISVVVLPVLLAFKIALPKNSISYAKSSVSTPSEKPMNFPDKGQVTTEEDTADDTITDGSTTNTYKVTGMAHYMDNIMFLARANPYYEWTKEELISYGMTDEKIWKYEFFPQKIELLPEPDNPYDPNAIKVLIDGEHVGYIKRGSCTHLLKLIKNTSFVIAGCEMGGGPYKYIAEEYDDDPDNYYLEEDEINFFIHLRITEKDVQQTITSKYASTHVDSSSRTSNTHTKSIKQKDPYIINPKTMVIHRRSCPYAQAIDVHTTDSKSAAIAVGYRPCKHCKP